MARGYLLRPKNDGQWSHWRAVFGWACLLVAGFFFLAPLPANGQKPAKPTGLMAQEGDGEVTLTWSDLNDPTVTGWQYKVKSGGAFADVSWLDIPNSGAATTSYVVMSLTNGYSYRFKVRAVNSSGPGIESNQSNSATPEAEVPAKPTGLMAQPGDGLVTLTWDDPGDSTITKWQYRYRVGNAGYVDIWTDVPASGATTTMVTVTGLANNSSHRFQVRAVNANGPGPQTAQVSARPLAGLNVPPTAQAGVGSSVSEGASVTLDGSNSSDPEGLDLTFEWSQTGGTPTVVLSGAATATATFTAPTELLVDVDLEFTLSVSDGVNDAVTDMVTITVLAGPNDPPTADAGAGEDTTFEEGATVTLDGSGSFDPEDVDLTYLWSQTGGTPTVVLSDADTDTATFTAPTRLSEDAILQFTLSVSDGVNDAVTDFVTVTVEPLLVTVTPDDQGTIVTPDGRSITVVSKTGIPQGVAVTLPGGFPDGVQIVVWTPSADVPRQVSGYSLGSLANQTVVDIEIDPPLEVRVCLPASSALRDEALGRQLLLLHYREGVGEWEVLSDSMDDGLLVCASGFEFSPIAVGFPNRAPGVLGEVANSLALKLGNEAITVDFSEKFTDSDGDDLTYSVASSAETVATATSKDSKVTIAPVGVGEATITVTAMDVGGATAEWSIQVTVEPANSKPSFTEGDDATRQVPENSEAGTAIGEAVKAIDSDDDTLSFSLEGDDADLFAIDEGGQITVGTDTTLDYEASRNRYELTVEVSDGNDDAGQADPSVDDSILVTIEVTDEAETPRAPGMPEVIPAAVDGDKALEVSWTAPENPDRPPLFDYEVHYRVEGQADWKGHPFDGIDTSTTIKALWPGTTYEVRVRAVNEDGPGEWSETGTGTTDGLLPITVSFEAGRYTATEGGAAAIVAVVLDMATNREMVIELAVIPAVGDFGLSPESLTFAVGDQRQTFEVTAVEDADADDEEVRIEFGQLPPGVSAGELAAITVALIDNDREAQARFSLLSRQILSKQALSIADDVNITISSRVESMTSPVGRQPGIREDKSRSPFSSLGAGVRALGVGGLDPRRMLGNSSFVRPLGSTGDIKAGGSAGEISLWGGGSYHELAGGEGDLEWDGDLGGLRFGIDKRIRSNFLAGASVSLSKGYFDYRDDADEGVTGRYESDITSVHPYAGWSSKKGVSLWGTVGYGRGEMAIDEEARKRETSDSTLRTASVGLSGRLSSWGEVSEMGMITLRAKAEASLVQVDLEGSGLIEELAVNASRLRLAVELGEERTFSGNHRLGSSVELGLRHDGGDGETGAGIEVGGRLGYSDEGSGFKIEGRGRVLVGHQSDYEEWGAQVLISYDPGVANQGLSFRLQPAYGVAASGVRRLWEEGMAEMNSNRYGAASGGRLDAELGYGFTRLGGMLTPYGVLSVDEARRRYRLGGRFEIGSSFGVSLEGERSERVDGRREHGVLLIGEWLFGGAVGPSDIDR